MREFIVKTNFGYTYKWNPERIAQDYADTAVQWQEDELVPKTHEQLYKEILVDEDELTSWFNDYIRYNYTYAMHQATLIDIDHEQYKNFINSAILNLGEVVG